MATTVTIGVLTPDDNDTLWKEGDPSAIYTDYIVENRYERDRHIYMSGITSPNGFQGQSAAFVRIAAPTLLWICDWTASRFKEKPEIPNPELLIDDWVLMYEAPELASIVTGNDGVSPLFRVSGTYVYGKKSPATKVFDDVVFPLSPWILDQFSRVFPSNKIKNDISMPANQRGAGNASKA